MTQKLITVLMIATFSGGLISCSKMESVKPSSATSLSLPLSSETGSSGNTGTVNNETPTTTDNNGNSNSPVTEPPVHKIAEKDARNLVQLVIGASANDLRIANNLALAPALGILTFAEILAPLALSLSKSALNCMSFKVLSFVSNNYAFQLGLSCEDVQGTIEIRNTKDQAGNHYSLSMDTKTDELTDNSDFTLTQSHDSLVLSKETDATFKIGGSTLQVEGSGLNQFTPSTKSFALSQTIHVVSDGYDIGTFTVTGNHLHASQCGLDSGSVEITSGDTTLLILINSCGKNTVTFDGELLNLDLHL